MDDCILIMIYQFLATGFPNIIYWIQNEILVGDCVIEMRSFTLSILGHLHHYRVQVFSNSMKLKDVIKGRDGQRFKERSK